MARRRRPAHVHGLAIVDKPAGVTSHDVVGMLRRRFDERRIGHAGTLDPGATGVLVVGVGMVTRLLRFVADGRKRYTGEVVLGVETDTLDADGTVVATHEMGAVSVAEAQRVAADHLTGEIDPGPADGLRRQGRRPAAPRAGADRGSRSSASPEPVTVHSFEVTATDDPGVLAIEVECSAGTYVRTLAADLGHLLGGGAHLRNLRRTAVGPFTIDEARPPDEVELLAPIEAVRGAGARGRRRRGGGADRQRPGAARTRRRRPVGDDRSAADGLLAVYEAFGRGPGQAGGRARASGGSSGAIDAGRAWRRSRGSG